MQPRSISLDPSLRSFDVSEIENKLKGRIAGQDEAVSKFCGLLETFFAGYGDTNAPVGVILEMGPTGTGKTSLIENLCEILFSNPKAFVRINCADFGDSHQVNRMVGAPPGYIGYKDKLRVFFGGNRAPSTTPQCSTTSPPTWASATPIRYGSASPGRPSI